MFQYHWLYEGVVGNSEICIMARFECVGVWIDWDAVWIFPSLSSHSLGLILSRVTYVNGHLSKVMCFIFSNVDAYTSSNIHILEWAKHSCCLCDTIGWMNISGINNLAHPESIGAFDHVSIHVCCWRFSFATQMYYQENVMKGNLFVEIIWFWDLNILPIVTVRTLYDDNSLYIIQTHEFHTSMISFSENIWVIISILEMWNSTELYLCYCLPAEVSPDYTWRVYLKYQPK